MRTVLIVFSLALAVPALALAAQPSPPGKSQDTHGKSAPKVMYVLKGTVTAFTASTGGADGSLALTVAKANRHKAALKDQSLSLVVKAATKVVFDADGQLTEGETVVVQVKADKRTTDAVALLDGKNAKLIIDRGAAV
jgi:hypothetical protein